MTGGLDGLGGYSRDDLTDVADPLGRGHDRPEIARSGSKTGVGMATWVQPGMLMTAEQARQLGAQLILAADLHDQIANTAVDEYAERARKASPIRRLP